MIGSCTCCKDCVPPKRHFCCWDDCPEYQAWKKQNKEAKAKQREESEFAGYLRETGRRLQSKRPPKYRGGGQ